MTRTAPAKAEPRQGATPGLFVPDLIDLESMALFGERDFPAFADEAKQAVLRLNLRRQHGSGLRGQVVSFDRRDAAHAALLCRVAEEAGV